MAGPKMGAAAAKSYLGGKSSSKSSSSSKSTSKSSSSSSKSTSSSVRKLPSPSTTDAARKAAVAKQNAFENSTYGLGFNQPGISQLPVSQSVKKPSNPTFGSTLTQQVQSRPVPDYGELISQLSQTQRSDAWGSYGGIPRGPGEKYTDYQKRADAQIQAQADKILQEQYQADIKALQEQSLANQQQQLHDLGVGNDAWVNTGDPAVDNIANQYLKNIWDSYGQFFQGLPQALTSQDVESLSKQVDKVFGPDLARLKQVAEDYYNRQLKYSQDTLGFQKDDLNKTLTRGKEDIQRDLGYMQQDFGTNQKVLGRSMQEAKQDVADAYAASGRAFSGKRQVDEQRASQQYQDELLRQQTALQRQQDFGNVSTQRLGQDVAGGLQQIDLAGQNYQQGLNDQRTQALQNLTDFRKQMIDNALNNANNTPYQLAPSFFNQPAIGNVGKLPTAPKIDTTVTQPKYVGSSSLAPTPQVNPYNGLTLSATQQSILAKQQPGYKRTLTTSNPVIKVPTTSTSKVTSTRTGWF